MKKTFLIILAVTGLSGFTLWHLYTVKAADASRGDLTTQTSSVDLAKEPVAQADVTQAGSVPASTEQPGGDEPTDASTAVRLATTGATVNAPTLEAGVDRATADFVASGKPEAIQAYFAERRRARAALMQQEMSWESEDRAWSEDLQRRFEEAEKIVPGLGGVAVSQADCRETICALHIWFEGDSGYRELAPYVDNIGMVLGSEAWVHHDADPNVAIVYIAKPDTKLPDLEKTSEG